MTDNNFRNRTYAQFADAVIMNRQRISRHRSSGTTNDDDLHLRWIVPAKKLRKSNIESFYILDTPSRSFSEPCFHITGSYGNEYKVTFALKSISCSCDDTPNPCKHVLFIVQRLGVTVISGLNIINPVHIMHLTQTVPLHRHMLDPKTTMLCLSYTSGKCGLCPSFLNGTSSTCYNCALIVHSTCVPDISFSCPQCLQPWQGIPIQFEGRHRNFHHILRRCRHPVADIPTPKHYQSQRRRRTIANHQQQQPPHPLPILQPPYIQNAHLPQHDPIPEANNFSSTTTHVIPMSPDKKIKPETRRSPDKTIKQETRQI